MKIGIILHPYGENKPGGLARTIYEWTKALLAMDQDNEYIIFLKKPLNNATKTPLFSFGKYKVIELKGGLFWREELKAKISCDIYIFQTPVLPLFHLDGKTICIVQDFPYKYLGATNIRDKLRRIIIERYHKFSMKRADLLIAVSHHTRTDIIRFFKIKQDKIKVIPMGYKSICSELEVVINLPKYFFLFVGVIKERKNVQRIIEAYSLLCKKMPDLKEYLVLAGKAEGDYYKSLIHFINKENITHRVCFIGYLNDQQLSFAYKQATALVFPSQVEGFGFPVLEAFDCGVPVITSNIGGPSEIGANGTALLVDPHNTDDIEKAMEKVVVDVAYRNLMIRKGKERALEYSWEKTAQKTMYEIKKLV